MEEKSVRCSPASALSLSTGEIPAWEVRNSCRDWIRSSPGMGAVHGYSLLIPTLSGLFHLPYPNPIRDIASLPQIFRDIPSSSQPSPGYSPLIPNLSGIFQPYPKRLMDIPSLSQIFRCISSLSEPSQGYSLFIPKFLDIPSLSQTFQGYPTLIFPASSGIFFPYPELPGMFPCYPNALWDIPSFSQPSPHPWDPWSSSHPPQG